MELEHQFTVPVGVEEAWAVLLDLDRVAPCFPGATLTGHDDAGFTGTVKVKLGPITLLYKGSGRFAERDEANRQVVVEASGKDSRGAGTANAKVTASLRAEGSDTRVHVLTDLKVTGKPAQLSRGLISEVGGRLVERFAECLDRNIRGTEGAAAPSAAAEVSAVDGRPPVHARGTTAAGAAIGGAEGGASAAAAQGSSGTAGPAAGSAAGARPAESGAARSAAAGTPHLVRVPPESEPIDLLGTAGMPVLKRALPIVGGLVLLAILIAILRRRR